MPHQINFHRKSTLRKSYSLFALLLIVTLLTVYVGSYSLLLRHPTVNAMDWPIATFDVGRPVDMPSKLARCAVFIGMYPAHRLDRILRPEFWNHPPLVYPSASDWEELRGRRIGYAKVNLSTAQRGGAFGSTRPL